MNFWREIWERERDYAIAWAGDLLKGALALIGLFVFYGFIRIGKVLGYDKDRLDLLERIDFGFVVATVVITGLLFLGKILVRRKPETRPNTPRSGARKK
jgi:hypothetical protein